MTRMFIKSFEYEDLRTGWKLERTEFDAFNLLVGNSGVGKTKILRALTTIAELAFASAGTLAAEWNLEFDHTDGAYVWSGRVEQIKPGPHDFTSATIVHESLQCGPEKLFTRSQDATSFQGLPIPSLSNDLSGPRLLSGQRRIQPILQGLRRLLFSSEIPPQPLRTRRLLDQLGIPSSQGQPVHALEAGWLVSRALPEQWVKIESAFRNIFPSVEDVAIEATSEGDETVLELKLRESSAKEVISHEDVASGMRRTLGHLIELVTAPHSSVILIDEFENSLGANCMPDVVRLLHSRPDLQFIITSHHPYVINNIPKDTWKLVQRKGSNVRVTSARDIPALQDASHHQAYLRLVNLPEFEEGIA